MERENPQTVEDANQLIIAQEAEIRSKIAEEQALIGKKQSPSCFMKEYENNPMGAFIQGVEYLTEEYSSVRRVRGDGNCFYRGFLFGYLEGILLNFGDWGSLELSRVTELIVRSKDELVALGYSEIAIETFWEVFVDALNNLSSKTTADLESMFNEEGGRSDYMVWYCRLLVAGHLKANADHFLPFIGIEGMDIEAFCKSEVEPMGKECEQVQIIALTAAFQVGIRIEYLDGRPFGNTLNHIIFPDGTQPKVALLYRPRNGPKNGIPRNLKTWPL